MGDEVETITMAIPMSILDDCKQRDARCCRALLVSSLEVILDEIRQKKDEHKLAPVSCGVCAVCKTSASDSKNDDDPPSPIPTPTKVEPTALPARQLAAAKALEQMGSQIPSALLQQQMFAMQAAMLMAASRSLATNGGEATGSAPGMPPGMFMPMMMPPMPNLRMLPPSAEAGGEASSEQPQQPSPQMPMMFYPFMPFGMPPMMPMGMMPPVLRPMEPAAPKPAAPVPAIEAKVTVTSSPDDSTTKKRTVCNHMRSKFNSTGNLKRRVHTLLFWKTMLGTQFPVVDNMLRDIVWKNLNSCEYGIKTSNGHPKFRSTGACVNPFHYSPRCYRSVLSVLEDALRTMRLLDTQPVIAKIINSVSETSSYEELHHAFDLACATLRKATIVPQHSC
eukprot:m.230610 g.230610  ORF g.230610 m.230610 type:complete len:392 (-) comp12088_c0_seq1:204-1379(-)